MEETCFDSTWMQMSPSLSLIDFREKGREVCRFVIMHQQAVLLSVKWDGRVGGSSDWEGGMADGKEGVGDYLCSKTRQQWGNCLLPTGSMQFIWHSEKWQLIIQPFPLSTSVLPRFIHSSQKHDLSIHQGRRVGNGESDRYRGSERERRDLPKGRWRLSESKKEIKWRGQDKWNEQLLNNERERLPFLVLS